MNAMNFTPATVEPLIDGGQVTLMSENDKPLFDELHLVLKKHGALRRFGVTLLHQHFMIEDDEVLLEVSNRPERTQVTRPVKRSSLNETHIETAWRLDSGRPLSVMNCVPQPDGTHQERHSDIQLKRDIRPLDGALSMVLALNPARYFYRSAEFEELHLPTSPQLGVMAQDVALVLPELVQRGTSTLPSDYLSVDYVGLVPVLVGAIKEQQVVIEKLQRELSEVERSLAGSRQNLTAGG